MKKLLILFSILFIGFQLSAKNGLPPIPKLKSSLKWDTKSIDLGSANLGFQKCATFYFTNIGKSPITITSVKFPGYWGPSYSKDVILPGKQGYVELNVLTNDTSKGFGICQVEFSNGEKESLMVYWQKVPSHIKWKTSQINNPTWFYAISGAVWFENGKNCSNNLPVGESESVTL